MKPKFYFLMFRETPCPTIPELKNGKWKPFLRKSNKPEWNHDHWLVVNGIKFGVALFGQKRHYTFEGITLAKKAVEVMGNFTNGAFEYKIMPVDMYAIPE